MISILIPVYNVERHLRACLDSILGQDFNDYEVILVNDGSQDSSVSICEEYASRDERFILVHQENQGFGAARNTALKFARGEYIYFMDSDDKLLPGLFFAVMREFSVFEYDTVFFGFKKQYLAAGNVSFEMVPPELDCRNASEVRHKLSLLLTKGFGFGVWQQMFKKEFLLEANVQFPNLKREADIAFLLELYKDLSTFKVLPKVYYCYHAFYAPHKNNPAILQNHITLYRLLDALLHHPRAGNVERSILVKYFVLWFCHVVPLHIYLNSRLSFLEKLEELAKLLDDGDFRRWRSACQEYLADRRPTDMLGLFQRIVLVVFGLNSSLLLYWLTSVNYWMKFRFNLNYKKLYYKE